MRVNYRKHLTNAHPYDCQELWNIYERSFSLGERLEDSAAHYNRSRSQIFALLKKGGNGPVSASYYAAWVAAKLKGEVMPMLWGEETRNAAPRKKPGS